MHEAERQALGIENDGQTPAFTSDINKVLYSGTSLRHDFSPSTEAEARKACKFE